MKSITAIFLLLSSVGFSQTENDSIYKLVEKEAEFNGGYQEMKLFITKNLNYPPVVCVEGMVVIGFIVEKEGSLSEIKIVKGIPQCLECNEEAIKVVEQMPKWIPARQHGEIVRSYVYIPITFKLH